MHDFDCEKVWYSREINHGDWPFRFIAKLEYTESWGDEAVKQLGKYLLSLLVVSPTAAKQSYTSAMKSCGFTDTQLTDFGELAEYEMLVDYGTAAVLWQDSGNNLHKLMCAMRAKLFESDLMFGFAMDRQQNAIGATGWDTVAGRFWPDKEISA
jgi:hypothetical protein